MRKCAEISSTSTYCLAYYAKKRPDRREICVGEKRIPTKQVCKLES